MLACSAGLVVKKALFFALIITALYKYILKLDMCSHCYKNVINYKYTVHVAMSLIKYQTKPSAKVVSVRVITIELL